MKKKIDSEQLRGLILKGISSEELNSKYDYSEVTNMSFLFFNYSGLKTIPELDTSNVTIMRKMFKNSHSLETIHFLDTSNVIDMKGMFENCTNLKSIPLLDIRNDNNIDDIIKNCPKLSQESIFNIFKTNKALLKYLDQNEEVPNNFKIVKEFLEKYK